MFAVVSPHHRLDFASFFTGVVHHAVRAVSQVFSLRGFEGRDALARRGEYNASLVPSFLSNRGRRGARWRGSHRLVILDRKSPSPFRQHRNNRRVVELLMHFLDWPAPLG